MALRPNSLKLRTALALSSLVVVALVLNAFYLILTKRSELRLDIQDRGVQFASLTAQPLCVGYETYYRSGYYKFRELVRDLLELNPDVVRLKIINVDGRVLFDSLELEETDLRRAPREQEAIRDPQRLEAVKRLDITTIPGRAPDGTELLEIVKPWIEDWGRHRYSVLYYVSYANLRPQILQLVYTTGGLTLASILVSVVVALALASRITRPLEELTGGAQRIAEGQFDRQIVVRSTGEIQILADAFNEMAARLEQNLAELESSNRKLATANEELKELDRMKSDLLANVSHELRTPLTAIRGYADYLREGKLGVVSEKQEKAFQVIQKNLDRLSRSISDLLDFSRMDAGLALKLAPFPFAGLAEQIGTTVRAELERKHIRFLTEVEPGLPPVIGDRDMIGQVLENLVINAIKFTPEGGSITVGATRIAGSRPAAEVRIADTGIGIPPSQLGKIFNRFHQVDGSSTRRFGGVGLGLAIVKSILDAHGSTISVESRQTEGTVFRFQLPLVERAEAAREGEPSLHAAPGNALVLGDGGSRAAVVERLERRGVTVLHAGGEAAGQLARARAAAVVLLEAVSHAGCDLAGLLPLTADGGVLQAPLLLAGRDGDGRPVVLRLGRAAFVARDAGDDVWASALARLVPGNERRGTALLAETDAATAARVRAALWAGGVAVAEAGGPGPGTRPALLIVDMMSSGPTAAALLRSGLADASAAPVLFVTPRGTPPAEWEAAPGGVESEALLAAVGEALAPLPRGGQRAAV